MLNPMNMFRGDGGAELDTADWVTDEGREKMQKLMGRGRRFK
jgi:hypothetical protein